MFTALPSHLLLDLSSVEHSLIMCHGDGASSMCNGFR